MINYSNSPLIYRNYDECGFKNSKHRLFQWSRSDTCPTSNETAVKNNTTNSIFYTYDLSGNRSQMIVTGTQNYRMEYEYDANNRLLRENKFTGSNNNFCNTTRYNYDNNGNMLYKTSGYVDPTYTQMGEFSITTTPGYKFERNVYDSFNRLTSTYNTYTGKSASYTYYPNDLRQSKTVDNTTTEFFWDGDNIALETDESHNLKNIYTYGVNRIMSENAGGTKQYYMYDPHGDVQGLVNSSGTLTKTYEYDAFGNEINKSATDTNPFRYCGEYYDTETDNIYLRHRYYSPSLGRFTTEDPIRDGCNWYVYCDSNSIVFTDPSGYLREPGFYDPNFNKVSSGTQGAKYYDDPDAAQFGKESYVYKAILELGNAYNKTNNAQYKKRISNLANRCRQIGNHPVNDNFVDLAQNLTNQQLSNTEIVMLSSFGFTCDAFAAYCKYDAMNYTSDKYHSNIYGGGVQGDADAYRHIYFAALLAKSIGKENAGFYLDAHEFASDEFWKSPIDADMDIHNNDIGLAIGNPNISIKKIRNLAGWKVISGQAVKIKNNTLVPTDNNAKFVSK